MYVLLPSQLLESWNLKDWAPLAFTQIAEEKRCQLYEQKAVVGRKPGACRSLSWSLGEITHPSRAYRGLLRAYPNYKPLEHTLTSVKSLWENTSKQQSSHPGDKEIKIPCAWVIWTNPPTGSCWSGVQGQVSDSIIEVLFLTPCFLLSDVGVALEKMGLTAGKCRNSTCLKFRERCHLQWFLGKPSSKKETFTAPPTGSTWSITSHGL